MSRLFLRKRKLELAPAATSADHSHTPHVPHTEHSDGSHISMHILPGSATRGWVVAPAVNETLLIPCKVGGARTGEVQVPHRFRPGWMPCPVRFPKTNTAIRVMQPLPCTVGHSCRNVGAQPLVEDAACWEHEVWHQEAAVLCARGVAPAGLARACDSPTERGVILASGELDVLRHGDGCDGSEGEKLQHDVLRFSFVRWKCEARRI